MNGSDTARHTPAAAKRDRAAARRSPRTRSTASIGSRNIAGYSFVMAAAARTAAARTGRSFWKSLIATIAITVG